MDDQKDENDEDPPIVLDSDSELGTEFTDSDDDKCKELSESDEEDPGEVEEGGGPSNDSSSEEYSDDDRSLPSEKCPICLRTIGKEIGVPETCEHHFCLKCILEWSKKVATCPIDRKIFPSILVKREFGGEVVRIEEVEIRNLSRGPNWEFSAEFEPADVTYCEICGNCDREERLLLCDGCDLGYHLDCLEPALDFVPIEDWFCTNCTGQRALENEETSLPTTSNNAFHNTYNNNTTSTSSRPLRVPRTSQTLRILQSIRRSGIYSDDNEEQVGEQKSRLSGKRTVSSKKRRSTVGGKRRRKLGRRKRRKRKMKNGLLRKSRVAIDRRPNTAKGRLAQTLGIIRPRKGQLFFGPPSCRSNVHGGRNGGSAGAAGTSSSSSSSTTNGQSINSQKYHAGIAPLRIFGRNNDLAECLETYSDDDQEELYGGGQGGTGGVAAVRSSIHGQGPLILGPNSHRRLKGIARSITSSTTTSTITTRIDSTFSRNDILGPILSAQYILLKDKNIRISRDGTLIPSITQTQSQLLLNESFLNSNEKNNNNNKSTFKDLSSDLNGFISPNSSRNHQNNDLNNRIVRPNSSRRQNLNNPIISNLGLNQQETTGVNCPSTSSGSGNNNPTNESQDHVNLHVNLNEDQQISSSASTSASTSGGSDESNIITTTTTTLFSTNLQDLQDLHVKRDEENENKNENRDQNVDDLDVISVVERANMVTPELNDLNELNANDNDMIIDEEGLKLSNLSTESPLKSADFCQISTTTTTTSTDNIPLPPSKSPINQCTTTMTGSKKVTRKSKIVQEYDPSSPLASSDEEEYHLLKNQSSSAGQETEDKRPTSSTSNFSKICPGKSVVVEDSGQDSGEDKRPSTSNLNLSKISCPGKSTSSSSNISRNQDVEFFDIDISSIPMPPVVPVVPVSVSSSSGSVNVNVNCDENNVKVRPTIAFSIPSRHRMIPISKLIKRGRGLVRKDSRSCDLGTSSLAGTSSSTSGEFQSAISRAFGDDDDDEDSPGNSAAILGENNPLLGSTNLDEKPLERPSLISEIFGSDSDANSDDDDDENKMIRITPLEKLITTEQEPEEIDDSHVLLNPLIDSSNNNCNLFDPISFDENSLQQSNDTNDNFQVGQNQNFGENNSTNPILTGIANRWKRVVELDDVTIIGHTVQPTTSNFNVNLVEDCIEIHSESDSDSNSRILNDEIIVDKVVRRSKRPGTSTTNSTSTRNEKNHQHSTTVSSNLNVNLHANLNVNLNALKECNLVSLEAISDDDSDFESAIKRTKRDGRSKSRSRSRSRSKSRSRNSKKRSKSRSRSRSVSSSSRLLRRRDSRREHHHKRRHSKVSSRSPVAGSAVQALLLPQEEGEIIDNFVLQSPAAENDERKRFFGKKSSKKSKKSKKNNSSTYSSSRKRSKSWGSARSSTTKDLRDSLNKDRERERRSTSHGDSDGNNNENENNDKCHNSSWRKPSKSFKERNYRDGKPKTDEKFFKEKKRDLYSPPPITSTSISSRRKRSRRRSLSRSKISRSHRRSSRSRSRSRSGGSWRFGRSLSKRSFDSRSRSRSPHDLLKRKHHHHTTTTSSTMRNRSISPVVPPLPRSNRSKSPQFSHLSPPSTSTNNYTRSSRHRTTRRKSPNNSRTTKSRPSRVSEGGRRASNDSNKSNYSGSKSSRRHRRRHHKNAEKEALNLIDDSNQNQKSTTTTTTTTTGSRRRSSKGDLKDKDKDKDLILNENSVVIQSSEREAKRDKSSDLKDRQNLFDKDRDRDNRGTTTTTTTTTASSIFDKGGKDSRRRRRKKRDKSLSPAKAIFADGDSIVVSINFGKKETVTASTTAPEDSSDLSMITSTNNKPDTDYDRTSSSTSSKRKDSKSRFLNNSNSSIENLQKSPKSHSNQHRSSTGPTGENKNKKSIPIDLDKSGEGGRVSPNLIVLSDNDQVEEIGGKIQILKRVSSGSTSTSTTNNKDNDNTTGDLANEKEINSSSSSSLIVSSSSIHERLYSSAQADSTVAAVVQHGESSKPGFSTTTTTTTSNIDDEDIFPAEFEEFHDENNSNSLVTSTRDSIDALPAVHDDPDEESDSMVLSPNSPPPSAPSTSFSIQQKALFSHQNQQNQQKTPLKSPPRTPPLISSHLHGHTVQQQQQLLNSPLNLGKRSSQMQMHESPKNSLLLQQQQQQQQQQQHNMLSNGSYCSSSSSSSSGVIQSSNVNSMGSNFMNKPPPPIPIPGLYSNTIGSNMMTPLLPPPTINTLRFPPNNNSNNNQNNPFDVLRIAKTLYTLTGVATGRPNLLNNSNANSQNQNLQLKLNLNNQNQANSTMLFRGQNSGIGHHGPQKQFARSGGDSPFSPEDCDGDDLFEPPQDHHRNNTNTNDSSNNNNFESKNKSNLDGTFKVPSTWKPNNNNTISTISTSTGSSSSREIYDSLFGPTPPSLKKNNSALKSSSSSSKTSGKSNLHHKSKSFRKSSDKNKDGSEGRCLDEEPNSAVELRVKEKLLKKISRQERVVEEVKLSLKPHYGKKVITKDEYKEILRKAVPKICHNRSGEINPSKIKSLIEAYVKKIRHNRGKKGGNTLGFL